MIRPVIQILTFAAFVLTTNVNAQSDEFQIREDEHVESRIRKVNAHSSGIPFDKTYAELTLEQKQILKSEYEKMGPDDEPPYPSQGLKPIVESVIKAQRKFHDFGPLSFVVDVSSEGDAKTIGVIESTSEEMTQYLSSVLFQTKYKPAVCNGLPCNQQWLFHLKIK